MRCTEWIRWTRRSGFQNAAAFKSKHGGKINAVCSLHCVPFAMATRDTVYERKPSSLPRPHCNQGVCITRKYSTPPSPYSEMISSRFNRGRGIGREGGKGGRERDRGRERGGGNRGRGRVMGEAERNRGRERGIGGRKVEIGGRERHRVREGAREG